MPIVRPHSLRRHAVAFAASLTSLLASSSVVAEGLTVLHVGDQESWLLSAQGNLRDDPAQAISFYGGVDRLASIIAARKAIDADNSGVLLTGRCEAFLRGQKDLKLVIDRLTQRKPGELLPLLAEAAGRQANNRPMISNLMARADPRDPAQRAALMPLERLRGELLDLIDNERPKIVEIVHWAASNGDRSENGDYLYGKKRLREIDRRIRFLTKRLEIAEVVDPSLHAGSNQVFFGSTVTYIDDEGIERTITIMGIDEADSRESQVSWISPVARALLKAHVGDEVLLPTPGGVRSLEVVAVQYPQRSAHAD